MLPAAQPLLTGPSPYRGDLLQVAGRHDPGTLVKRETSTCWQGKTLISSLKLTGGQSHGNASHRCRVIREAVHPNKMFQGTEASSDVKIRLRIHIEHGLELMGLKAGEREKWTRIP